MQTTSGSSASIHAKNPLRAALRIPFALKVTTRTLAAFGGELPLDVDVRVGADGQAAPKRVVELDREKELQRDRSGDGGRHEQLRSKVLDAEEVTECDRERSSQIETEPHRRRQAV